MSAEYILSEGNEQVILCERGIRTFEPYTRNTLDLTAVPVLRGLTHLPIVVDPSHATGLRDMVSPMGRASLAAGADGLIVEVHHEPERALSDGPQSLRPEQFAQLMRELRVIAPVVGKQLDPLYLDKAQALQAGSSQREGDVQRAIALGAPGAFSHQAARQFLGPDVELSAATSFREVFSQVAAGRVELGVLPLENSLTGSIHENYDLLLEYDVQIVGELLLRIVHALVSRGPLALGDVKRVYSHPQVFDQCREFLDEHRSWECLPVSSTAAALARLEGAGEEPGSVAIASPEAAVQRRLHVLREGIETNPRNFTRFVVISAAVAGVGQPDKSSLVFATQNRPGALVDVLKLFSDADVNLVKLESRPIHGRPWEYMFYVDLEGDLTDERLAPLVGALEQSTVLLKRLGSYVRA